MMMIFIFLVLPSKTDAWDTPKSVLYYYYYYYCVHSHAAAQ